MGRGERWALTEFRPSAALRWRPLRRAVARERRLAQWASRRRSTAFAYEFVRFGVKQAWACLFGGVMLALLLLTHELYPAQAALARYDFLTLAAVAVQAGMLLTGLETREEARVILLFHVAGTAMELFKTQAGSWVYPEAAVLRVAGVPLFTGFMYAAGGSYIARAWRVLDVRFTRHPPLPAVMALAAACYVNFFAHHWLPDMRGFLFAACGLLFARTWIHYRVWRRYRRMPLLLGQFLVSVFIWLAENVGTFSHAWVYPNQARGWAPVGPAKLGAWFLLMLISYALVASVHGVAAMRPAGRGGVGRGGRARSPGAVR